MLHEWVPQITFGDLIGIFVLLVAYADLRTTATRNYALLRKTNDATVLAASHSKLSFDSSVCNAARITSGVTATTAEIRIAVSVINSMAEEKAATLAQATPQGTLLPEQLRVFIVNELAQPPEPHVLTP